MEPLVAVGSELPKSVSEPTPLVVESYSPMIDRSADQPTPGTAGLRTFQVSECHRTQVKKLTRRVHEASLFGDILFSNVKFDRFFDLAIDRNSRQHLGLAVSLDERVLGCCYCSIGAYFIGDGGRIVSVNTICVDPDVSKRLLGGKVALRLAKGIETWAEAQQATHILYHVTAGIDGRRADRFFRQIGIVAVGGNYCLTL
ncbi:hypothetical protein [uncultured Roseobacter sp.]|uniref:hypothetical protein n=1 Tax=uncultured Roseobacter sp. TaxID=114847 RepID=UPI00260EFFF2|nr:hypothetical protein [uncultured Roseobacter sp.]